MIPPRGFKSELYPLRHRLQYAAGLSLTTANINSVFFTILRHTNDVIAGTPGSIIVNPHNTGYVTDAGAAVAKMSIIDKVRISLKFNMTSMCNPRTETAAGTFANDGIEHLHLTWRPVFFSFPEKLDAADDDTGTTVATILGLLKTAAQEDVVPITTNNLPVIANSDKPQPMSTVNIAEIYSDYNMTTDTIMEDHPWDEDLFQEAMQRYTNKGALKACVGRTRHVHLTRGKNPYKTFYMDKFVPRSVRRIMPYSFFGIQINLPTEADFGADYYGSTMTANRAHVGIKMLVQYHEWNADHYQEMSGTAP